MRKKNVNRLLLTLSMALVLSGCGKGADTVPNQDSAIELIDPVNAESGYEKAARRTLYQAAIYSGTIVPYYEEYSMDTDINFGGYDAYPGEEVKAGQTLAHTDTSDIDEQIEKKKESIADMEEEQQEYLADMEELLKEQQEQAGYWKVFVDANEASRPPEYVTDTSEEGNGQQVKNPAYEAWEAECGWVEGEYRIAEHRVNTTKLTMEQRQELYELDYARAQYELESLKKSRQEKMLLSGMDGSVVGKYEGYEWQITKETALMAVGDLSQKLLKCDYIKFGVVDNAMDVYALIDGKRYEVEYQPMSPEEYLRLSANQQELYSTFTLVDGEDVNFGDFAVITVVTDKRQEVVSVPAGSVRKDESGNFVYLVTEEENVYTPVRTGLSDGVYTEILSGVEEGDKILYSDVRRVGSNTAKVERGDIGAEFGQNGYMTYPSNSYFENPIENGTVYFVSSDLILNQHVDKGDVIARVRVEQDSIGLSRNETRLSRLKERIADMEQQDAEGNQKLIENYQEQAQELEKKIAKQKADFATTEIVADRSGIVIWMEDYKAEDILLPECQMALIANEETCYIRVEDDARRLQYGNEVEIRYQDKQQQSCCVKGTVATVRSLGVSESLRSGEALIRVPKEEISNMSMNSQNDMWYRYRVSGTIRSMENVLLVPKAAVWTDQGQTYVNIKKQNGDIVAQSFVAGGYDNSQYWVIEGLTEGMEVCLE
ncbi:MAG: hypothetical protein NC081_02050 [Roseburia sp.]|nr:hypothetical protein [Roseburia sp.]